MLRERCRRIVATRQFFNRLAGAGRRQMRVALRHHHAGMPQQAQHVQQRHASLHQPRRRGMAQIVRAEILDGRAVTGGVERDAAPLAVLLGIQVQQISMQVDPRPFHPQQIPAPHPGLQRQGDEIHQVKCFGTAGLGQQRGGLFPRQPARPSLGVGGQPGERGTARIAQVGLMDSIVVMDRGAEYCQFPADGTVLQAIIAPPGDMCPRPAPADTLRRCPAKVRVSARVSTMSDAM